MKRRDRYRYFSTEYALDGCPFRRSEWDSHNAAPFK
jgi:hypothetical protein